MRLRWRAEWALARVLGRRMLCAACGQPVCVVWPVVWRGRLVLVGLGIQEPLVRVRFADRDRLELLHGELDVCPTAERPWARAPDVWPS
jgi:hypothetical protein